MGGNKWSDLVTSTNTLITTVIIAIGAGVFFLARGIADRSATAYLILGAIIALGLVGLGGGGVLGVMFFANVMQRRRDEVEAQRFAANAQEDMALMLSMQRAMNMQNQGLLRQVREQQKMLPKPGNGDVVEGFTFEESLFDELDD